MNWASRLLKVLHRLNFTKLLPLFTVMLVAVIIAVQNIDIGTYFSGWDNVHPEFNLPQYAYRVFFGAWLEFQGLGAPAAQGHLAEVPRIPIIFLLKLLLPDNLIRYVFVFLMFFTGGVGTFLYLQKVWLNKINDSFTDWIAALGAIYYLLNLITLQQFYIAFEMFTVQFAFFPFLLLSIHVISKKVSAKTILIFLLVQFLIASSAHTPTVFYIGAIFSICYTFFLNLSLQKNFRAALEKTVFLGLLTLFANSYWIIPNLYYLVQNAGYVTSSRANQLFDPESLWSVREAGDLPNFLTGTHYIFTWKDFNFSSLRPEYIFDSWRNYLVSGFVLFFIIILNLFSLIGLFLAILDSKKGWKRWGIVLIYSLSALFIWVGLFLPGALVDFIYGSKTFGQAFRNPVTKFSIIYSFAITVLLCQFYESIINKLREQKSVYISKVFPIVILFISLATIVYISWPSFTGDFINKKLKVTFPSEYVEMYSYLRSRPENFRVLELPFFSQAGWSYNRWINGETAAGYQGIGFNFFGIPQAVLTPDFARWEEANDFFYYELRHALNSENSDQLRSIFNKYNVDLITLDESAINQYDKKYNYEKIIKLLDNAGAKPAWKENFLTVYEIGDVANRDEIIIPKKINYVSAKTERVRRDFVFENVGEYIDTDSEKATTNFPFINLTSLQINDAIIGNDKVSIKRDVPTGNYELKSPGLKDNAYKTPAAISFKNRQIQIVFPKTKIVINNTVVLLPQLKDVYVDVNGDYDAILVWINGKATKVYNDDTAYLLVSDNFGEQLKISFVPLRNELVVAAHELENFNSVQFIDPAWKEELALQLFDVSSIAVETEFPFASADLNKFPSENCSYPEKGTVSTTYDNSSVLYVADSFGVNCNHYSFDFLTPDYSYLMRITGKNFSGRSVKFFIDYSVPNSLPEEYLGSSGDFSMDLTLPAIVAQSNRPYVINWETRSFGYQAKNELDEIKIVPLNLDLLSQTQLEKIGSKTNEENDVYVNDSKKYFNFLYFINADCKSEECYLGIDQSYDPFWLALSEDLRPLSHYRYNNWANVWEINRSGNILIIYFPQVVSLLCLFLVAMVILILVVLVLAKKVLDRRQKIADN